LLLIPHLGGGGAEQVMTLLAEGLSQMKYEVHLGLMTQASVQPGLLPDWVTVHPLGASRVRAGGFKLLRLVWRLRPNVILSGIAHLNFLVLLLKPLFPRATQVLVRQNSTASSSLAHDDLPSYTRFFYHWLYRRADRIICQSRAMAADLATLAGLDERAMAVLPNPLDLAGIRATLGAPSRWPGAGPNLLAIGRLSMEKGFDLLLEAMAQVVVEFPTARLTLLGVGPQEGPLKGLCHQLRLEAVVTFAGYQRHPYAYYPGATLFVLPSRHEGMPNALLEALVADLPVVAMPASGGIESLLADKPRVWLAQGITSKALAKALLQALRELSLNQNGTN
jgi:glycosyltransferase involved in cell wall biosynthesis